MAVERRTAAGCRHGTGLWLALVVLVVLLTACAISDHPKPSPRIALLAPFEGRYRELGYEAYYAARLALTDSSTTRLELLAVDDGGSPELARLRAQAIQHNPAVLAVVVLGYTITDPTVLDAFADVPVIVVGDWGVDDVDHGRFALASSGFHDLLTIPSRTEVAELAMLPGSISGGEILSLTEFANLRDDLTSVVVISGSRLPDETYSERIQSAFPFADPPGLYSTLTYDAVSLLAQVAGRAANRESISEALGQVHYSGINGNIRFVDGYWADMPLNRYAYSQSGELQAEP